MDKGHPKDDKMTVLAYTLAEQLVDARDQIDGICLLTWGRIFSEAELLAAGRLALDMIERGDVK